MRAVDTLTCPRAPLVWGGSIFDILLAFSEKHFQRQMNISTASLGAVTERSSTCARSPILHGVILLDDALLLCRQQAAPVLHTCGRDMPYGCVVPPFYSERQSQIGPRHQLTVRGRPLRGGLSPLCEGRRVQTPSRGWPARHFFANSRYYAEGKNTNMFLEVEDTHKDETEPSFHEEVFQLVFFF